MNASDLDTYENRLLLANDGYMPTQEELLDALQNSVFPSSRESSRESSLESSRELPPELPPALPNNDPMPTGAVARFMSVGMSLQHTLDTCLADAFGGIRNRLLCLETALTLKRRDEPDDLRAALERRQAEFQREQERRQAEFQREQERRQAETQAALERSQAEMRTQYERRHEEMRAAYELRQEEMRALYERRQEEMRALFEKENARPVSPNCVADEIEPDHELRQKVQVLERANARLGTRVDELEREIKKKQRT